MKIGIDEITEQGVLVEEVIDPRCWEMDSFDIRFQKPFPCRCLFSLAGKSIAVKVHCAICRTITCSRCMEVVDQDVEYDFDLYYGLPLKSDTLEIDGDIRENILLQFPMKVLCSPDCKGLCPECGVNLNKGSCACQKKPERFQGLDL